MNTRQRFIATLKFGNPDRVPFQPGGPRESTLRKWHTQGLPEAANWMTVLLETIGVDLGNSGGGGHLGVNTTMIPRFEEKVIERRPGSLIVQDWKGNICEISDEFDVTYLRMAKDFVTRNWLKCPVENRDDWEAMKKRYDPDDPSRFEHVQKWEGPLDERDGTWNLSWSGVFWQLREWMGFEELCMAFLTQPDLVQDMVTFWSDFIAALLEKLVRDYAVPDHVVVNEDMAYKEKAMLSYDLAREYIVPVWRRWGEILKGAGCEVYGIDSDGFVGGLIPLWLEAGAVCNMPMEVAAGNDIVAYREKYGTAMAYQGGIDKRAMAKGGDVLRDEMRRIEPVVRRGGYIPGCDHGIPPDVSWPNMIDYARQLAEITGWK